jgi:head-tail adaptor
MPGKRSLCYLQKAIESVDDTGSVKQDWDDICSFKAVLVPLKQEERKQAFDTDTLFSDYRLVFSRRRIGSHNRDEINTKNRIRIGTRKFNIVAAASFHDIQYELDLLEIE